MPPRRSSPSTGPMNSDVAEALLVSEFASQIKHQGVACVKVSPTSSAVWKSNRVGLPQ